MLIYRFQASFASIPLQVTAWTLNRGRGIIQHRPARGNGVQTSDRGQNPRTDQLTVTLTGTDAEITAARDTLITLDETGEARTFVHPLDGAWAARLEGFSEQSSPDGVTYSLTLVEDRNFVTRLDRVVDSDSGTLDEVRVAAERFDEERAQLVIDSPALAASVPTSTATMDRVEAWDPEVTPADEITAGIEATTASLSPAQERLDRVNTVSAYRTATALLELRAAVERYGRKLRRVSTRTFALDVLADVPLVSLLARIYGAEEGARIVDDVIRLNSIANPVRVQAGSLLRLPART